MEEHAITIINFNQWLTGKHHSADREGISLAVHEMLMALIEKWTANNHTSRFWQSLEYKDFGIILFIHASNDTLGIHLQAGIHTDGIYLEMSIASPGKLWLMPDDFWSQLLELSNVGNFTLTETESFTDDNEAQYPALKSKSTGNLIRLMQKLLVFPILHGDNMDPGNLCITWPFEKYSINEVAALGTQAYAKMVHLNKWLHDTPATK